MRTTGGPLRPDTGIDKSDRLTFGLLTGMFRGDLLEKQPVSEIAEEKEFEAVYQLSDFTVDPCVREKQDSLARTPDGLYLDRLWVFTNMGSSSGLMVHEVELIPGEIR